MMARAAVEVDAQVAGVFVGVPVEVGEPVGVGVNVVVGVDVWVDVLVGVKVSIPAQYVGVLDELSGVLGLTRLKSETLLSVSTHPLLLLSYPRSTSVANEARGVPSLYADPILKPTWSIIVSFGKVSATPPSSVIPVP
jgi:hypothetical protein